MAIPRRRNNNNNNQLRLLIPIISIVSAVLLLLLALLSFFAPSPPDTDHFPNHRHKDYINIVPFKNNNDEENQTREVDNNKQLFRVPIHGGRSSGQDLWISKRSKNFYGCSNASHKFIKAELNTQPNRYLVIATSGGLNQQRTGITDAVVAARILNATLVVPKLDQKSFWKDSSNFTEIFDVDWFISSLWKDVKIIKELPRKGGKVMSPYRTRVPRKCTPSCYEKRVLPLLIKKHAVQLSKFDYRLANKLDTDLQKLRCRVNYHALRFTESIHNMGRRLVQRMRMRSKHYIALHLRFEPDMLAFSGCYYGGGEKEKKDLGNIRRRWKTLHSSNPDKARRQGRCPLTPEEVGLMLRALGFGSDIHIYVASGEVYGGEKTLAPLKALFPHFHSKDTITRQDELSPFSPFSSRMAALDFIVCDESDVFVTNNNGNMAKILAGRRRYFGHKRTVRPNAKKLNSLFLNRLNMTWEAFASKVRTHQRGFMGEPNEVRPGRGEFHENPSTCICEHDKSKENDDPSSQSQLGKDSDISGDDLFADDEPDYDESQIGLHDQGLPNITDYSLLKSEEPPELEDMLSD